jgi:hypothetical protein
MILTSESSYERLCYPLTASMHVHGLQIIEEGWTVHVRLFGDWDSCVHGSDDSSWLKVASAAAFGQVGLMWARELLHTGRAVLGWDLLRCVEGACVRGGLGDSHENLIEVCCPRFGFFFHLLLLLMCIHECVGTDISQVPLCVST